jgi:DNA-binding winged helix-turn-helix (wHTH) protein
MRLDQPVCFPPFCLDPYKGCVWRGAERIALIPKDFAMLSYLATNPQRLVSYEELFKAVWEDTVVSHGVLKVHLCRIRRALDDNATNPQFIETVPRKGYRFIAPLGTAHFPVSLRQDQSPGFDSSLCDLQSALALVDWEANSAQLHEWLEDMLRKVRSLAFAAPRHLSQAA